MENIWENASMVEFSGDIRRGDLVLWREDIFRLSLCRVLKAQNSGTELQLRVLSSRGLIPLEPGIQVTARNFEVFSHRLRGVLSKDTWILDSWLP